MYHRNETVRIFRGHQWMVRIPGFALEYIDRSKACQGVMPPIRPLKIRGLWLRLGCNLEKFWDP